MRESICCYSRGVVPVDLWVGRFFAIWRDEEEREGLTGEDLAGLSRTWKDKGGKARADGWQWVVDSLLLTVLKIWYDRRYE